MATTESTGDSAPAKELLESLAETLDTTGSAIVWLDFRQRVVKSTESAQHVLREAGVSYEINQPMVVQNKREDHEFQQILQHALQPAGATAASGFAIVTRHDGRPPLMLRVTPVSSGGNELSESRIAALVMILDPQYGIEIEPDIVQRALNLTRAEAEVAVYLAQGKTVLQIAQSTNRLESTIRSHVKRILAKRGRSRQMDLVLEVLTYSNARRLG